MMNTKITLWEVEYALRHVQQAATKGNEDLFASNADYLRSMVETFITQEATTLRRNHLPE